MRPTSLPAFGPALVAAILLAGCAPEGPAAAPAGEAAAERPVPDHIWPPRVGERYPDLQLLNVDGDRISDPQLELKAGEYLLQVGKRKFFRVRPR